MNTFFKIANFLFRMLLVVFLVGGAIIVVGQLLGVFLLSESIVVQVSDLVAPWTFAAATLCALCAFISRYQPDSSGQDVETD